MIAMFDLPRRHDRWLILKQPRPTWSIHQLVMVDIAIKNIFVKIIDIFILYNNLYHTYTRETWDNTSLHKDQIWKEWSILHLVHYASSTKGMCLGIMSLLSLVTSPSISTFNHSSMPLLLISPKIKMTFTITLPVTIPIMDIFLHYLISLPFNSIKRASASTKKEGNLHLVPGFPCLNFAQIIHISSKSTPK